MNKTEIAKKHNACVESTTFDFGEYNDRVTLKQRDDIIVEATRIILNEQFERLADFTISQCDQDVTKPQVTAKLCKVGVDWRDEQFWTEIANPKRNVHGTKSNQHEYRKNIPETIKPLTILDCQRALRIDTIATDDAANKSKRDLLKKAFKTWSEFVERRKNSGKIRNEMVIKNEKIEEFVRNLKKRKKKGSRCASDAHRKIQIEPESFKNRFKAQQEIIDLQKAKLVEQNKIIEEMKLGKLHEDVLKSLESTRAEIQDVYSKCSVKVKCKMPPVMLEDIDDSVRFIVNSKKAPKMLQKMEERAEERARRRQVILERKRSIDENRKRTIEEALEKKRVQDEEEKRRNLEAIKERRRKELEAEKLRQANKQRYLVGLKKAEDFHERKLMRIAFKSIAKLVETDKSNMRKSEEFYEKNLKRKTLQKFLEFIEEIYVDKNCLADDLFKKKLLHRCFRTWRSVWYQMVQANQVAEDLFELKLQSNTFVHWHRYVCRQIVIRDKLMKKATVHYKNRILFQYFYQWRSLPAVLQLEQAKEEKKRKWREKVWEILPDYKPPQDDFLII